MRYYAIGERTGIEGLHQGEREAPVPGTGEASIRVIASALNRRDLALLRGFYGGAQPVDRIPLSDGAGEVTAVGAGVDGVAVGDIVVSASLERWRDGPFDPSYMQHDVGISVDGWLAETIVRPAAALVKVPAGLDPVDAAAMTVAGGTAWQILVAFGGLKAGDVVLSQGTGGVSTFAVQIARMFGATAAITSSSTAKLAAMRAIGADIGVNYVDTPAWGGEVARLTGGAGANVIIETGGAASLDQSFAAAAVNGRIGFIGSLAGPADKAPNLFALMGKNLSLKGIASSSRAMLAELLRAYAANAVKPVIGARFGFADAPAAFAALAANEVVGKVVIEHR